MKPTDFEIVRDDQLSASDTEVRPIMTISDRKLRQSERIREIRTALVEAGFVSLDQQALVLGLSRSSTWAVLRGNHKASGLRPKLIASMLTAPNLPPMARAIIVKYIDEKLQGLYGHNAQQRKRFRTQMNMLLLCSGGGGSGVAPIGQATRPSREYKFDIDAAHNAQK